MEDRDADEETALLPDVKPTPLPMGQMSIIALMSISDNFAFFVAFPMIPQMVHDIGLVPSEQVGYYSGMVESVFSFCQLLTVLQWGRLSDRWGRKPVLLVGLLGSVISLLGFGVSWNLPLLILSRSVCGVMNGNVGVIRTVVGELTDESNQARGFTIPPLMQGIGLSLGPLVGGLLAHPAERYSWLDYPFLRHRPYLLPCFVAAVIPAVSFVLCLLFLKETLPPAHHGDKTKQSARRPLKKLMTPRVIWTLVSFVLLTLSNNSYVALTPLFCFTPIKTGGLGFNQRQTGTLLGIRGVVTILMQFTLFAPMQRRLGSARLYKILICVYPILYIAFPLLNKFAYTASLSAIWIALTAIMLAWSFGSFVFAANSILITEAAPSSRDLGALNGLSSTASSLARTTSPFASNTLYALSVDRHVLGGQLIWACGFIVSMAAALTSRSLTDEPAPWRLVGKRAGVTTEDDEPETA